MEVRYFFNFFRGNIFSVPLESEWQFVPQKGDIVSFKDSNLDSRLRDLYSTSVFKCIGIRYELIHTKGMATTLNGVNVYIELEPKG